MNDYLRKFGKDLMKIKSFLFNKEKINLILIISILYLTLLLSDINLASTALADSTNLEATAKKVEKAADKIVQDDQKESTKEKFGQEKEGAEMIDEARSTAQKKLKSLANTARKEQNSEDSLPASQKDFLKKF